MLWLQTLKVWELYGDRSIIQQEKCVGGRIETDSGLSEAVLTI